jgi:RHS repeat-associated protein
VNAFNPFTGSVSREITDIDLPASIGEQPLHFERLTTSRYQGGIATPFGPSGNWRHNYLWSIRDGGLNASGEEIIVIDYPSGSSWEFSKPSAGASYLTALSRTQDRVEKIGTSPDRYSLWHADGSRMQFVKQAINNETHYLPEGEYDKYGLFYAYTLDTKNRVTRVTDPAGHYIQMNYAAVGNFTTAFVQFNYSDANATSVSVAGDFNAWNTQAHPMVQNGDDWTITIPVQAGSTSAAVSYQYKLVVDGSTWISDPANPDTFPEGGPSTGNNSLLYVDYSGEDLDYTSSVPVLFEVTAPNASSVSVAGSFNGWNSSTDSLVKNGDVWTLQVDLGQGDHYYKFVIDGNWQTDSVNPFTVPDGYGGHNSHLVVGPRQEAITDIQTSDGRSIFYDYEIITSTATLYAALKTVTYLDNAQAHYTYMSEYIHGGRPKLKSADDPRYPGAGAKIAYEYRQEGVDGFVFKEKSLSTGETLVKLQATGETERRIISGTREEVMTYNGIRFIGRAYDGEAAPVNTYFDNGYGMLQSTTDADGNTTSYERTWEFGIVKKTTYADGSSHERSFTDNNKPFHIATETDALARVTSYQRDTNGRPTRIDYPDGSYESFTYNAFGQALTHRLQNGGSESFAYNAFGQKTSYTDPLGNVSTYTYHTDGRLASVTDPRSNTTSYEYNSRGLKVKESYADANYRAWSYDDYGNLLSVTDETGSITTYMYDEYARKIFEIDPLGHTTEYTYDGGINGCGGCGYREQPDQIISPAGHITEFTYDNDGRRLTETRGLGSPDAATTTYTYDALGRMSTRTDPLGNSWSYTYDNRGRRLTETNPLGKVTSYTYDVQGNQLTRTEPGSAIWTMTYDSMNRLLTRKDPLDQITTLTYDAAGRLASQTDPLNRTTSFTYDLLDRQLQSTHPDSSTTSQSYDAVGNRLTSTDELGRVSSFVYDKRKRLVVVSNNLNEQFDYTYDAAGRRTAEMLPGGLTRHTTYDAAGRVIQVTTANGTADEANISYSYDDDGRMLSSTDAMGQTTNFTYDTLGRQLTVTTPLGLVTSHSYDANGNRLTQTRPDNSQLSWAYDALGRTTSETDAASDTISYTYTPRGQVASITDSRDAVTQFGYDLLDRRTTKTYADNAVEQSSYDAAGQLTQFTTARGVSRSYSYDKRGRLTAINYSDSTPDATYTYNAAGERLSMSNANASIAYNYDGVGRSSGETQTLLGHPLGARTFDLSYNVDSRLTQIDYPGLSAPQVTYGYSLRGQLSSVATSAFNVAYTRRLDEHISAMSYSNGVDNQRSYDLDGRLTETLYRRGSSAPFSKAAYTLNKLGQRTSVERANGSGDSFSYDSKDQLTGIGYEVPTPANGGTAQYAGSFAYDAMGNRTSASDGFNPAVTYTTNNLNQYTSRTSASSAVNPTYDADGNTLTSDGLSLTWDAENRLTKIQPIAAAQGDRRIEYAYDPTGRRVRKTVDLRDNGAWIEESDTHYTYWDWNVIEEHRDIAGASDETRRLIWGEDLSGSFQGAGGVGGLLAQEYGSTRWFYHYDGNGNITELTDNAGSTVATYRYTAFGDVWSSSGSAASKNQYRFSTKPLDEEVLRSSSGAFNAGLYYYGFRYYDPVTGRWPNRDPIGEQGGLNPYGMVGNNPINLVDFDGRVFDWIPILGTIEVAIRSAFGGYPGMNQSDYTDPCSGANNCTSVDACLRNLDIQTFGHTAAFVTPSAVRIGIDIGLGVISAYTGFLPATIVSAIDGIANVTVTVWGADKIKAAGDHAKRDYCKFSRCKG